MRSERTPARHAARSRRGAPRGLAARFGCGRSRDAMLRVWSASAASRRGARSGGAGRRASRRPDPPSCSSPELPAGCRAVTRVPGVAEGVAVVVIKGRFHTMSAPADVRLTPGAVFRTAALRRWARTRRDWPHGSNARAASSASDTVSSTSRAPRSSALCLRARRRVESGLRRRGVPVDRPTPSQPGRAWPLLHRWRRGRQARGERRGELRGEVHLLRARPRPPTASRASPASSARPRPPRRPVAPRNRASPRASRPR
jgi:hypothetical protein